MIAPRLHRSRTYYRYLLSYTVLLLAVLTVFAVFFHVYFVRNLRDNLLEMQKSALTQTAERLDSQFNQINAIDYQVSSFDENFLSIYLDESTPLRDMRIVREFKNLVAPSTFIVEMALVNPDDPNVYTASAVYSRPVFFQRIFRFFRQGAVPQRRGHGRQMAASGKAHDADAKRVNSQGRGVFPHGPQSLAGVQQGTGKLPQGIAGS